jgi:hypothetical protein
LLSIWDTISCNFCRLTISVNSVTCGWGGLESKV